MLRSCVFALSCSLLMLSSGCGDDDGGSRFSGKSEAEMFTIVQGEACDLVIRCINNKTTKESCLKDWMTDDSAYKSTIDEATRSKIDACLDHIAKSDCATLKDSKPNESGPCAGVFDTYVDLDKEGDASS